MVKDHTRNSPGHFGVRLGALMVAAVLVAAACTSSSGTTTTALDVTTVAPETTAPTSGCADVIDATIVEGGSGTFRISATILSADTGWEKYADAWEVRAPDGTVLGTRVLAHPHVDEQPFTRSLDGVVIPEGVATVEIVARDLVEGFCGASFELAVPGR